MDRDTEAYMLSTKGINGLKIISRDSIPLAPRTKVEGKPASEQGDLRYGYLNGIYVARKDYMISGEGRPPLVIREVASKVEGMKKYALIDMSEVYATKRKGLFRGKKERTPYANVSYAYSEGLDIEKMIKDSSYAAAIISLFQEERLEERQQASLQSNSNVVYIGTVSEREDGGYVIKSRSNYEAVIGTIQAEIERKNSEDRASEEARSEASLKKTEENRKKVEATNLAYGMNEEQAELVMAAFLERFGMEAYLAMQKRIAEQRKEGIEFEGNQHEDSDDGEPQW